MVLPRFNLRRDFSREGLLTSQILTKANSLFKLSELDYFEFLQDMSRMDLVLPTGFRRTGSSDIRSMNLIDMLLEERHANLQIGLKFGGTVQVGATNPYLASRGEIVLCDTTTGGFTVRLPDPTNEDNDICTVNVKLIVSGGPPAQGSKIIVDVDGAGLIDGDLTRDINVEDVNFTFTAINGSYSIT